MSRYYTDSDDEYAHRRQPSSSVRASGWHTPVTISTSNNVISSSPTTRIIVEAPFGSKQYDYDIDRSQHGRIIVSAYQRDRYPSEYGISNKKRHVAVQTFPIPHDADVDRLHSHIEHATNRLIIEIPREEHRSRKSRTPGSSTYVNQTRTSSRLLRSPDVERMLTSPTGDPQLVHDTARSNRRHSTGRKLEYRIDCRGYTRSELEIFLQGRDLIVQGKTNLSSPDRTQQRISKKFSRKITFPHAVDLKRVVSYMENGELRIEAPLKPGFYSRNGELISGATSTSPLANRSTNTLVTSTDHRVRSYSPLNRHHYRRNERNNRRQDLDQSNTRHVTRSKHNLDYPVYISQHDVDRNDDYKRTGDDQNRQKHHHRYHHHHHHRHHDHHDHDKKTSGKPIYKSVYSPKANASTSRMSKKDRQYNYETDDNSYLKF